MGILQRHLSFQGSEKLLQKSLPYQANEIRLKGANERVASFPY